MTLGAQRIITGLALCLVALPCPATHAANILGFFPSPSTSHLIKHCSVAAALAEAGHNVTVLSTTANVFPGAKYNYININTGTFDAAIIDDLVNKPKHFFQRFFSIMHQVNQLANDSLSHATVQRFLREHRNSFDLLILGYFMNEFHLGLAAHFNCPVIVSFIVQPIFSINAMVGNPPEAAYVPTMMSGLKQPMGYWERVMNFVGALVEEYTVSALIWFNSQKYYEIHFPAHTYPPLNVMRRNISLVFVNHHFTQGAIRPNVPALIEIGGIQIKEQPDPLPTDIAQILDNAPEGVIYFSLGSKVQGSILSTGKAKIMFAVLSQLPYKVLWKWGDSEFPGNSSNIVYKSWLPQDDILAHSNVKIFITHGGQGSVAESQYHKVPMVGIPLFGDQHSNMAVVQNSGFGLAVDYFSLTEDGFRAAILEVLQNPKYAKAVTKFSILYRDRPMTPRQLVVYWSEYVLRHKGAPHLQSPAVHMSKWQLLSLDVIGFAVLVSSLLIVLILKFHKLCHCCIKVMINTRKSANKSKKNR